MYNYELYAYHYAKRHGFTNEQIARVLKCSISKVERIEKQEELNRRAHEASKTTRPRSRRNGRSL